jgi:hypothetical protein
VPNLVSTVAGAANFEKSTLFAVTDARASVGRVQLPSGTPRPTRPSWPPFQQAQGQLGSALSRLLVVSERYPDLKATANFRDLQSQLEGTENRIAVERGRFNDVVQAYDTAIRRFPGGDLGRHVGLHARAPTSPPVAGAETPPEGPVRLQYPGSRQAVRLRAPRPGRPLRSGLRLGPGAGGHPPGAGRTTSTTTPRWSARRPRPTSTASSTQYERATSNQIVVAIYPKMQSDSSVEDYTVRVAQSWNAGLKGKDNGIVLFIFSQTRTSFWIHGRATAWRAP